MRKQGKEKIVTRKSLYIQEILAKAKAEILKKENRS